MAEKGEGVLAGLMSQGSSEESAAISILFGTKDYQRLKMISEIPPSLIYVLTVLGTMQKRYKSNLLKQFDEEFLFRQKSRDRKGVVELVEVLLGLRRMEEEED